MKTTIFLLIVTIYISSKAAKLLNTWKDTQTSHDTHEIMKKFKEKMASCDSSNMMGYLIEDISQLLTR